MAETTYALGFLAVVTTPPALGGCSETAGFMDLSPTICGTISESTMPSSVTAPSVTGDYRAIEAVVLP